MMKWFNFLGARLRAMFRRESVLRDIEEELRVHVEMETETNIKRGMPPDEARAAALKSFGNPGRKAELGYEIRGGGWIENLWQDLRYAIRTLFRNPAFSVVTLLTLAIGIGSTTAIFSVVYALLLKPLPYPDSDRLVRLVANLPPGQTGGPQRAPSGISVGEVAELRSSMRSLSSIGVYNIGTPPERGRYWAVSSMPRKPIRSLFSATERGGDSFKTTRASSGETSC
jgi:hypothetical protein